jgi:4-amino-4-deoxy-L-arabinose transferase-like glycosyltransferase
LIPRHPGATVAWLIAATAALRVLFATLTGLGIDESYVAAAGRHFHAGYFDHPPAVWWLAAAAQSFATTPLAARLPFIALFALSTWLMFCLGRALHSPRAGFWAAVSFNLSPVFGVTTGTWVLPDGPLTAALLAAALCVLRAVATEDSRASWRWWLGAGACAGLALFAKYSAVLTLGGAFIYLLTQPAHRRWLARPQPYAALLLALAVFGPVLFWNATHGWASFALQGGRTGTPHLHPLAPLQALAGQALFVGPWVWLPVVLALIGALRRGPRDAPSWLLACLALPPIAAFTAIAAIADRPVLYHWAAPGYLMAFPLLGAAIARRLDAGNRRPITWAIASAAFLLFGVALVTAQIRLNFLPRYTQGEDPAMDAVDWTALRTAWADAGAPPFVAATNWRDAGKIDFALAGKATVFCLCTDARQYGLNAPPQNLIGRDILVVVKQNRQARTMQDLRPLFANLETLPEVIIAHGAEPGITLSLIQGRKLLAWPPPR